MEIKNNLKEIRRNEYNLDNKSEFARLLEVEEHTYLKWEKGSTPTLKAALMVAKKLNKKVEDIWHLE